MRIFVFLTVLFVLSGCFFTGPEDVAVEFKKLQYIHFDSTKKMLHPDSNKNDYEKFNNKQDFRNLKKYQKNFIIKVISKEEIKKDEAIVKLTITKPDIAKIVPVFGNHTKADVLKMLDNEKLPTHSFDSTVNLKKHNGRWLVITGK